MSSSDAVAAGGLRELLCGDVPPRRWATTDGGGVWDLFRRAAALADREDPAAERVLREVLAVPGLESRHYLQAWHALRLLGVTPPGDEAKHLYGVVLDVPVSRGLDTLAAYADHSCRYVNFSGSVLISEAPDQIVSSLVDQLLDVGRVIVEQILPWEGPRPPVRPGRGRLSLLCPSGLRFGEAPMTALRSEPVAARAFAIGTKLLRALVERPS